MKNHVVALLLASAVVLSPGCSTPAPRKGEWLSYEQINPRLRKKIGMQPHYYVRACGNMINVGQFKTEKELKPPVDGEPYEEIVIADGPSNFYDRRTGELVVECGYWSCTRHPKICDRYCPPPGWTCGWEMP
jgi:hypothetical protein